MKELTVAEMQEVNGGLIPVVVALGVGFAMGFAQGMAVAAYLS